MQLMMKSALMFLKLFFCELEIGKNAESQMFLTIVIFHQKMNLLKP